jgi:hypothetical protein
MSDEVDAGTPPADEPVKEAKASGPAEPLAAGLAGEAGQETKDRKAAADDDSRAERESTDQLAGLQQGYRDNYIYNFNGRFDASQPNFGPASGQNQQETGRRTRTGRLPLDEAAALCARFAVPPQFMNAARALAENGIVVLAGASGLGKRTSAIRLLLDAGAETVEIVSPTLTLEQLSKHDFEAGHGYLVEDWQQSLPLGGSDFDWLVLRNHVMDSKVHLVITAVAAKAGRSVTQFAWKPPTAEEVLKANLADADAETAAAADQIAGRIPDTYPTAFSVGDVAAIGRRLTSGRCPPEIVQEILGELSSDPGRHVREWLSDEHRTDDDLQRVTALCFAAGRSQRVYDVLVIRLSAVLRDCGLLAEPDAENDEKKGKDGGAEDAPGPRRPSGLAAARTRGKAIALLESEEGKVRFQGKEPQQQYLYHRYLLQELWRDFDMNFWIAIRAWLAELIGDTTIRDVQVSVALGLAILAYEALDEVEGSYLHPWADGEQSWSGQCTAVYVLWLMSQDDSLSPIALRIATDWVNSGSPACQWTAAAALSGDLGTAYPATAAARLWHLVGQWRDVPTKAVSALANLFASLVRENEGQEAHEVLELLKDRMNRARGLGEDRVGADEGASGQDGVRPSWRDDRRNRERAILCVLAVLGVRDPMTKHPSITSFLHSRPEHLELTAELWATILRNRPYRRRALEALLAAVRGYEYVSDDPETAARSLGDALTSALPAEEHHLLSVDFANIVARSRRPKEDTTATVQALLNAFQHLAPTGRAAQ